MIFIDGEPYFYHDMIDHGTQDVIEYKNNEKGEKIKVIKKIHKYTLIKKQPTAVFQRRNEWQKFGKALDKDNHKCTFISPEEVFMEPPSPPLSEKKKPKYDNDVSVKCSKCNGNHWTRFCTIEEQNVSPKQEKKETFIELPPKPVITIDRTTTIIINNLSKDAKEYDLLDLILSKDSSIKISKLYIPKEYDTNNSKGIAFVMARTKKQAEKIVKVLDNAAFASMILKASFIK